jgi:thioredoxin 1
MVNLKKIIKIFLTFLFILLTRCNTQPIPENAGKEEYKKDTLYKVTFIELGSVNCIPCKEMQPVLKSIEQKYGNQVKVIFYDVWTPAGKPYAEQYRIKTIPAQIFIGSNGKEFFRHEGFFPEEDVATVLKMKGVK